MALRNPLRTGEVVIHSSKSRSEPMPYSRSDVSPLMTAAGAEPCPEQIRDQLRAILESAAFAGSRRAQSFLEYVVEHALSSPHQPLKERTIAVELFNRPTTYDTSNDSIVRVCARDVRKRLKEYYALDGADRHVLVDLPIGSYVPEFRRYGRDLNTETVQDKAPSDLPRFRLQWIAGSIVICAILSTIIASYARQAHPKAEISGLDAFWEPAIRSSSPMLLCMGLPIVGSITGDAYARMKAAVAGNDSSPTVLKLEPSDVANSTIRYRPSHYTSVGDALTLAKLSALFARKGKLTLIKTSREADFSDLRTHPTVLIGGFSNKWNLSINGGLRWVQEVRDGENVIVDRHVPNQLYRTTLAPNGSPVQDFGVVSRFLDRETGQYLYRAAGAGQSGTNAAGEVLTNERYWTRDAALAVASTSENVQILVKVAIPFGTISSPEIVAVHRW
jgi:hypothetical protein